MKNALEELFHKYYQDVYRYLFSLCRDPALAEELAAEVFLEIVSSYQSFRGASDVRTWLFSVARHRWFAWLRKQGREVPTQELREDLLSVERSMEQQYADRETARRALELLDQEPERNRAIVIIRKIKEIVGDQPAVLTGDFNVTDQSEAYNTIVSNEFVLLDAHKVAEKTAGPSYTFHGFDKVDMGKRSKIDFVFVTPSIKVLHSEVTKEVKDALLSDHNPQWTDLEF